MDQRRQRDVHGDLDAFVSNFNEFVPNFNDTNRVWLNVVDTDSDGIPDFKDGTPNNPDTDGDTIKDGADPDIDGDGLPNAPDPNAFDPNAFDPDTDGDGIRDGLDPNPEVSGDNKCMPDVGTKADVMNEVIEEFEICAHQIRVNVQSTTVQSGGELRIIAPTNDLKGGFTIDPGGKLSVYSEELPDP